MFDIFHTCCCGEKEEQPPDSHPPTSAAQPQAQSPRPQMNRGASFQMDTAKPAEMNHSEHDMEPDGLQDGIQFEEVDSDKVKEGIDRAQEDIPTQCGCCPHVNLRPQEGDVVKRNTWCCYCCGAGVGCHSMPDPLSFRCNCACLHLLCESSDMLDQAFGLCARLMHCCFCTCVAQLPPVPGTPRCLCCSEVCCGYWAEDKREAEVGKRFSVDSAGAGEMAFLLSNRHVPLFCCCCGCAESLGRADCCRDATKCCCCRCVSSLGMPIENTCNLFWTCHQFYCQCRVPHHLPSTPCCACCGTRVEHRRMSLYELWYYNCRRCPAWCESCPCCRWCALCGYIFPCCCGGGLPPEQQEMK